MAKNAWFEPNHKGLTEYMLSGDLYPALEAQAAPIEGRIKALAAEHVQTGEYERSIHSERERASDRVRVRIVSDDDIAPILEARYHIFSRGIG